MLEKEKYIMAIDEGTSSLRTIIINKQGVIVAQSQREFNQIFPKSGWVEHDATEIWMMQLVTIKEAKNKAKIKSHQIEALAITNQRETFVMWNKKTGIPVYNAIVWGDSRTAKECENLKKNGYEKMFKQKTGLVISHIFSGTKMKWVLENVEDAKKALKDGELLTGTIDSWLIWNLTKGKIHATDVSNASRTLLFNIKKQNWDEKILELLKIPKNILPKVKASSAFFGNVNPKIFSSNAKGIVPIYGVIGDQQAALFGQLAFRKNEMKITYGTSNAILINTGGEIIHSQNGMFSTIAWRIGKKTPVYALEGNVQTTGAAIKWLRDGLKITETAQETDLLAELVKPDDKQKVYFVPALTGLGSPHWDSNARGMIIGIERGTKREHIARSTLEAICYETNDLIEGLSKDIKKTITKIKVDGGACRSDFIMQFQADISNVKIVRPVNIETTAIGAGFLAGLSSRFWKSYEELKNFNRIEKVFNPKISAYARNMLISNWKDAVSRSKKWVKFKK